MATLKAEWKDNWAFDFFQALQYALQQASSYISIQALIKVLLYKWIDFLNAQFWIKACELVKNLRFILPWKQINAIKHLL